MPKVSIYLPDALYDEVRKHGISLSTLTQRAVVEALGATSNAEWVARARSRKPQARKRIDVSELMAGVRDEFGL